MTFTKDEVYAMCKKIAPDFNFEPELIMAICIQEGGKDKDGNFCPDVARLEQGYYRRYVEGMDLATTSEILLSASYGIMQMMGLSLKEANYFHWWFDQNKPDHFASPNYLGHPLSQIAIPKAIDEYCVNLEWMIYWGCVWFDKKMKKADGNIVKALGYWNGDLSGKYADEVLRKYSILKKNG